MGDRLEQVGRIDCSTSTSTWHWNLEGKAVTSATPLCPTGPWRNR